MSGSLEVRAARRYAASASRVYEAFTDRELLAKWFSPSADVELEVLDFDLRVGGGYRFGFRYDSKYDVVSGVFKEITSPTRLAYTWTWEPLDPHAGIETLVTVELSDLGDECEVTVLHERFPDRETRERHDVGWAGALDRLRTANGEEQGLERQRQ
jgi:uncharacterized protein YndB with AHSA1/START domain